MAPSASTTRAVDSHGGESPLLCCYRNTTDRMVVVRVRGLADFFLERVVFPFEIMTFYCPRDCEVDVVMRTVGGNEQRECMAAEQLSTESPSIESEVNWRPVRYVRSLSVRSNASAICQDRP